MLRKKWLLLSLVILGLAASSCTRDVAHAELAPTTTPSRPDNGKGPWWIKFNQINDAIKERKDYELLFIGDSITHFWEYTREGGRIKTWNHYYGHRKALNDGIKGDTTQTVLWRLENGNIEGLSPKVVVLLIGTNNVGMGYSPEQTSEGIKAIVSKLREKMPRTKILLLGILPAGEAGEPRRAIAEKTNALTARLADGKTVYYLDIGKNFVDAEGNLVGFTDEYGNNDYVHPSGVGYQILAKAIEPKLAELLGDKPVAEPGFPAKE